MLFWLTSVVIAAAVIFGGGTRVGFMGDVLVQVLAICLLATAVWTWIDRQNINISSPGPASQNTPHQWLPIAGCALLLFLVTLQLTPLPIQILSKFQSTLPTIAADPFSAQQNIWQPISLTPAMTWAASLSLLAPCAVFLAVSELELRSRQRLTGLVVLLGSLTLMLGLTQVVQGVDSPFRFYEITNPTEAVGFFANRNHFASLLYVTLVFSAVWLISLSRLPIGRHALNSRVILWIVVAALLLTALAAGLAAARSRAGVILAVAALIGIAAMMWRNSRSEKHRHSVGKTSKSGTGYIAITIVVFATIFAAQFGLHKTLPRFEIGIADDLRDALSRTTLETARDTLPFGTGLGSFVPVYATVEKQGDLFYGYGNRAHNDIAEFLLEAGLSGAIIIGIFLIWFVWRSAVVWLAKPSDHQMPDMDAQALMLQRAATIALALLLAHSLVDYPLRTTAMATLFAFSCALLLPPIDSHVSAKPVDAPFHPAPPPAEGEKIPKQVVREQWEPDTKWPEAWLKKDD